MVPIRLGHIDLPNLTLSRSGIRWRVKDGDSCAVGDLVGVVNFSPVQPVNGVKVPFQMEHRDLQIGIMAPVAGTIHLESNQARGGFFDFHAVQTWNPDHRIFRIETGDTTEPGSGIRDADLIMFAGQRVTELAEDRSGLLTGWHRRARAARVTAGERVGTLLGIGICEQLGIVRGEANRFQEIFEATSGPAHVVFVPDEPVVPSARTLIEQMHRTPDQVAVIARDMTEGLMTGAVTLNGADLLFAGAVLQGLASSPLTDQDEILTRKGILKTDHPDAILLSIQSEAPFAMRHKRLDYLFRVHDYRLADAGPAFRAWLKAEFRVQTFSPEDIYRDYCELIDLVRARAPDTRFLIINQVSSSTAEDIVSYAPYDAPLAHQLGTVRGKEINLMLHDLARDRDLDIIDMDARAAELGARMSLRHGVHQNGQMQAMLRADILQALKARGVRGFS